MTRTKIDRADRTTQTLSESICERAKNLPGRAETILWDAAITGLGLRVNATGKKVWLVRYWGTDLVGKPIRRKPVIGEYPDMTLKAARARAVEVKSGAEKGADPIEVEQSITLGTLADKYRKLKKPTPGTTDQELIDRRIIPYWGKRECASIVPIQVTEWHDGITKTVKVRDAKTKKIIGTREEPALHTADRALDVLKAIFNWGIEQGLISKNPARFIVKNYSPEETERDYEWTADEIGRLAAVLDQHEAKAEKLYKPGIKMLAIRRENGTVEEHLHSIWGILAIRFLILTGVRKNEALKLRWDQIKADRGIIEWVKNRRRKRNDMKAKPNSTTRMTRDITEPLLRLLAKLKKYQVVGNPYVFVSDDRKSHRNTIDKVWYTIRDEAEIENEEFGKPRIHDLRHFYGQISAESDMHEKQIMQLMGHSSTRMSKRYSKYGRSKSAEMAGKVAGRLRELGM